MQAQRKAHLLHVTGRSSVGGVSVEGWWSPIYHLDLHCPLSNVGPAGGPTLPDRGQRRTDSAGGIWAEDCSSQLSQHYWPGMSTMLPQLPPRHSSKSFKVGRSQKSLLLVPIYFVTSSLPMLINSVDLRVWTNSQGQTCMSQSLLLNLAVFRDSTFWLELLAIDFWATL